MCPEGAWPAASAASSRALQPDLPEWDVGVAQPVHLDAPDVRLEQALVGVVEEWDDRRVLENQLLGLLIQLDAALVIPGAPRAHQDVVDGGVRVAEEVTGPPRVKQSSEEIIRVRDIGIPRVEEDRELALVEHLRERRPVGEIANVDGDPHRAERLLDLIVLPHDIGSFRARPDRDGPKASTS